MVVDERDYDLLYSRPILTYIQLLLTNVSFSSLQARVRINELTAQLNDVAHQYRMVEKRLLVRYKDRNPTPLGGLDALMKETYDRLIAISKFYFLTLLLVFCISSTKHNCL